MALAPAPPGKADAVVAGARCGELLRRGAPGAQLIDHVGAPEGLEGADAEAASLVLQPKAADTQGRSNGRLGAHRRGRVLRPLRNRLQLGIETIPCVWLASPISTTELVRAHCPLCRKQNQSEKSHYSTFSSMSAKLST